MNIFEGEGRNRNFIRDHKNTDAITGDVDFTELQGDITQHARSVKPQLSRRDFLKLGAVGVGAAIDAACGPLRPTTLLATPTPIPAHTDIQIDQKVDNLPPIEARGWAETENQRIDSNQLFQYVGDWIFPKDREIPEGEKYASTKNRAVDLQFENLKLVFVTQDNIQDEKLDQQEYRHNIAFQLNGNDTLKTVLTDIKEKLRMQNVEPAQTVVVINGPDYSNFVPTAIPNASEANPYITGIAVDNIIKKRPIWYSLDKFQPLENEKLPVLSPPLSSEHGRYIRTDNGEEVINRGAGLVDFKFRPNSFHHENVSGNLKALKKMGGTAVAIGLNAEYLTDEFYIYNLIETLRLAKERYGFRIMLEISDRGLSNPADPYSSERIRVVDEQIVTDWKNLLSNQEFAFWAGRTVDIFNIISEPNSGSVYNPNLEQASNVIRNAINNPYNNEIVGFSGGGIIGWNSDALDLVGKEWNEPQSTVVVHPYLLDNRPDITTYAQQLKNEGKNITIGEFGWKDWQMNPEWTRSTIRFFEKKKISYFVFGLTGGYPTSESDINSDYEVTTSGGELFYDYRGNNLSPIGEALRDIWSEYKREY